MDNSGYLYSLWIYQGPEHGEETKPHQIVVNFAKELPTKNYIVYADSYYGSFTLAEDLNSKGYKFVLSCKSDRPSQLFSKKLHTGLKRGSWKYGVWNKKILALSFWDSVKCNFISNYFNADLEGTKPSLVVKYNKYKGGVDLADSHWSRYLASFRNYKWTKAAVFALLKIALVNSYLIFNHNQEKKISQRLFIEKIILGYLEYRSKL